MTQKQIAESFSNGKFELVYPYFAENIQQTVIGENHFEGRKKVIENCKQTANYFKSITTDFKTLNVIEGNNRIAINGTAEFKKDNERVAFVSACDVYEFNNENKLERITSYCIQNKQSFKSNTN